MWIIEWSCLSDYEFNVSGWLTENEALKKACSEIVNHIETLDPDSDSELRDEAQIINNLIDAAEYRKAMEHWNDCKFNGDCTDAVYWTVRHLNTQRYYGNVPTLSLDLIHTEDVSINPAIVINDHTCVTCGNDKCSKREASCWKCGNPI